MALRLKVKAFDKAIRKDLRKITGPISNKVETRALNKALAKSRTSIARKLSQVKAIPVRAVRRRLISRRANRGRRRAELLALQLRVLGRDIGKPVQQRKGAKVGRQKFPGAFVATMPGGKRIAAARETARRLPIKEVGVPLLPEIEDVIPRVMRSEGRDAFVQEFERLMKLELSRRAR